MGFRKTNENASPDEKEAATRIEAAFKGRRARQDLHDKIMQNGTEEQKAALSELEERRRRRENARLKKERKRAKRAKKKKKGERRSRSHEKKSRGKSKTKRRSKSHKKLLSNNASEGKSNGKR